MSEQWQESSPPLLAMVEVELGGYGARTGYMANGYFHDQTPGLPALANALRPASSVTKWRLTGEEVPAWIRGRHDPSMCRSRY